MEIKILNQSKTEIELQFDNLTLIELLRFYLSKDPNVDFVAWKREHPTKEPILKIKSTGKDVKSLFENSIKAVLEDLENIDSDFKKLK